ncbi:MAG: tRNA pseudouridine(55) synthase TruB [Candidatus Paracaedibacteraceae bacterium]|nr:tRNA pseudouridine(55) synthase TruB [Candidatus Paracaedibacteraceae bacterium]
MKSSPQKKNNINGWLVIDKPLGMTSTKVGSQLKRFLRPKKIGHIGTLDPLASGVLTFALGEATKLIPYWQISAKKYAFDITFGERRSTDDAEGDVIERSSVLPTSARIKLFLDQFIGTIDQVPPNYSAIQVDGKRSYDRARKGEEFELPPRQVRIDDLRITQQLSDETFSFEVTCGTGTYVRSLARDIAEACGTVGYVSALRRIKDGCFSESQAIPLDVFLSEEFQAKVLSSKPQENKDDNTILLEQNSEISHTALGIFPLSSVLDDIPAVTVGEDDLKRLYLGQAILASSVSHLTSGIVQIQGNAGICAMGFIEDNLLKPKRLLHLGEYDVDYS